MSFFQKLFALIFGTGGPDEEKRRMLRDIGKTLSRQKQKFYNPKKELVLPGLANYLHEYYKLLGPAKNLVQRSKSSYALKDIIIETTLNKEQIEIRDSLEEKSIREKLGKMETKDVAEEVKESLISFFSAFDSDKIKEINNTYNMMATFLELIHFDFFFTLRKFDSGLQEDNFFYTPRFEAINADYVLDDLKDFYDIILSLDTNVNWNGILDTLKTYRSVEVVSRKGWKKGLNKLIELKRTRIIEQMIKHISGDPYYKPRPVSHKEKIVDEYLARIKTESELTIQRILKERRSMNIKQLTEAVFGTPSISRLKHYTEKENLSYRKKMLSGFIYVTPLNYVKAFLVDYFKGEVRDLIDLFLIRGKWTSNITSNQLSESMHQIFKVSDRLLEFDDSLAEEGDVGRRLRNVFYKADRDKNLLPHVRKMLKDINETAKQIILETGQHIVAIGKHLKFMLDDYTHKKSEFIVNWKEIETKTDGKLKEKMVNVYKKIFYFIKLLQLYNKEK